MNGDQLKILAGKYKVPVGTVEKDLRHLYDSWYLSVQNKYPHLQIPNQVFDHS